MNTKLLFYCYHLCKKGKGFWVSQSVEKQSLYKDQIYIQGMVLREKLQLLCRHNREHNIKTMQRVLRADVLMWLK